MPLSRKRRKNRRSPLLEGISSKRKRYQVWGLLVISKYYIVDLKNILNPRYIPKPLDSKKEGRFIINSILGGDTKRFYVELGETIAKYRIKPYRRYMKGIITKSFINLKYDYPPHRTTAQQKKDFRTISRRRMRAWLKKLELY